MSLQRGCLGQMGVADGSSSGVGHQGDDVEVLEGGNDAVVLESEINDNNNGVASQLVQMWETLQ